MIKKKKNTTDKQTNKYIILRFELNPHVSVQYYALMFSTRQTSNHS